MKPESLTPASMTQPSSREVRLAGHWTALGIGALDIEPKEISGLAKAEVPEIVVDGAAVERLDTVGVWILQKLLRRLRDEGHAVQLRGWSDQYSRLIERVEQPRESLPLSPPTTSMLEQIGRATMDVGEHDYEPEVWLRRVVNKLFLGWNVSTVGLGFNHQSNGRGDEYSRSWNRVLGSIAFERGDYGVVLRPWWRIPESNSHDNNSDITDYMGHFDLTVLARYGKHSFDLMLRNNLKTQDNHGAAQLGWTYPLTPKIKVYVQLFSGYGESLIDYNVNQTSIGAGLQLLDW